MKNLTVLIIYLLVTSYITLYVGRLLYLNGRHFIASMLGDEKLTDFVNKALLVGYYLVNLGYVAFMLSQIRQPESLLDIVPAVSTAIARILLTLGILHYVNVTVIIIWSKMNITKKPYL